MEFAGFDWDVGNRTKCKKHGLSIAEIESLFNRPIIILPDKENPQGERRFRAIGTTEKGRTRIRCVHAAGARRRHFDTPDQCSLHAQEGGRKL
jgi:uncharacterized DUF497 family protein